MDNPDRLFYFKKYYSAYRTCYDNLLLNLVSAFLSMEQRTNMVMCVNPDPHSVLLLLCATAAVFPAWSDSR